MGQYQIIQRIAKIKATTIPILHAFGVKRASVFGSVVRDDFTNRSDIDILVEFPDGKTLLDLVRLEEELKVKLRHKVDLVTFNSVDPLLKQSILAEQVPIYP